MAWDNVQSEPGNTLVITLPWIANGEAQSTVIPSLCYRVSPRASAAQGIQLQDRVGQFPQPLQGRSADRDLGTEERAERPMTSG